MFRRGESALRVQKHFSIVRPQFAMLIQDFAPRLRGKGKGGYPPNDGGSARSSAPSNASVFFCVFSSSFRNRVKERADDDLGIRSRSEKIR